MHSIIYVHVKDHGFKTIDLEQQPKITVGQLKKLLQDEYKIDSKNSGFVVGKNLRGIAFLREHPDFYSGDDIFIKKIITTHNNNCISLAKC